MALARHPAQDVEETIHRAKLLCVGLLASLLYFDSFYRDFTIYSKVNWLGMCGLWPVAKPVPWPWSNSLVVNCNYFLLKIKNWYRCSLCSSNFSTFHRTNSSWSWLVGLYAYDTHYSQQMFMTYHLTFITCKITLDCSEFFMLSLFNTVDRTAI